MGIATTPRGRARQARTIDGEILKMIAGALEPETLAGAELQLDRYPVTRPSRAIPVWAWVRYGGRGVLVEAELCGWTDTSCAVKWEVHGRPRPDRAWVWAGAVEPRGQRPAPGE